MMGLGGPLKEIQQSKVYHPQGEQLVADPLAAGNAVVFHFLEYVKPFISAGDCIGQHLAGLTGIQLNCRSRFQMRSGSPAYGPGPTTPYRRPESNWRPRALSLRFYMLCRIVIFTRLLPETT